MRSCSIFILLLASFIRLHFYDILAESRSVLRFWVSLRRICSAIWGFPNVKSGVLYVFEYSWWDFARWWGNRLQRIDYPKRSQYHLHDTWKGIKCEIPRRIPKNSWENNESGRDFVQINNCRLFGAKEEA